MVFVHSCYVCSQINSHAADLEACMLYVSAPLPHLFVQRGLKPLACLMLCSLDMCVTLQ